MVDAVLFFLVLFLFSFQGPFGKYEALPEGMSTTEACEIIQDVQGVSTCVTLGDRAYYVDDGIAVLGMFAAVAWFVVIYVVWQGTAGATPGKALLNVRVVDMWGRSPGMGKAAARSLLWVVDGAPWILPLVGFVTGLTTQGHQRIGDKVAGTFVVGKEAVGRPVQVPEAVSPAPDSRVVGPSPEMPGAPPTAPPMTPPAAPHPAGPPLAGGPADPSLPPFEPSRPPLTGPAPAAPPVEVSGDAGGGEPRAEEPPAAPVESVQPPGDPAAERSDAQGDALVQPAGTEAQPTYQPQWDAARGAYIQWDPRRGSWLQWDDGAKEWNAIS